jgi:flavorubredoxin
METRIDEIAPDIYRLSTYVSQADLHFNQFLVLADEPLLFHAGMRGLFESVSAAMATVLPPQRLRWITFGHLEADESGAMNNWLAVAPAATVAHGVTGTLVSVNDLADRPPRMLADQEVLDLGGKRVRRLETPHVPHGWDAGLLFEETTATLLCGDLFTAKGRVGVRADGDIVGPALAAEDHFHATCLTPDTGPTIRALAELRPRTMGLMHGPAYTGDCAGALRELGTAYDERHASIAGPATVRGAQRDASRA